jgi:4-hydroxy-3-methylbut-2-enyl diphosphate reductase
VTQTTLGLDETEQIVARLRHRFPAIVGPRKEDICYATTNRQQAVKELAKRCDLVLVVDRRTRRTRGAWSRPPAPAERARS